MSESSFNMNDYTEQLMEELGRYRRCACEQCGHEIDDETALKMWLDQSYDNWFQCHFCLPH
ncbi:MAG: hypothetical protein ACRCY4_01710 [Brevinema sp.]